jgi:hypothetical protein
MERQMPKDSSIPYTNEKSSNRKSIDVSTKHENFFISIVKKSVSKFLIL